MVKKSSNLHVIALEIYSEKYIKKKKKYFIFPICFLTPCVTSPINDQKLEPRNISLERKKKKEQMESYSVFCQDHTASTEHDELCLHMSQVHHLEEC